MTNNEMKYFISMLQGSYAGLKVNKAIVDLWRSEVGEVSLSAAVGALKAYQRNNESGFPPEAGKIYNFLQEMLMPALAISFSEAKVKNTYLYQKAVRNEGSIPIVHNPNGEPGPSFDELPFVHKRQEEYYNILLKKCRKHPLNDLPKMQKLVEHRDRQIAIAASRKPNVVIYGEPTPLEIVLNKPDISDVITGEYKKIETQINDDLDKLVFDTTSAVASLDELALDDDLLP